MSAPVLTVADGPRKTTVSNVYARRSMLSVCTFPGCATLTMGGTCVEHDVPVTVVFARGRPYVPATKRPLVAAAAD